MRTRADVQLLLWRAWLGATSAQVDAAWATVAAAPNTDTGYAALVDSVLGTSAQDVPNASAPTLAPWPVYPGAYATPEQIQAYFAATNARKATDLPLIQAWWASQMATRTDFPLQENLALFWHNHFATSNDKVRRPPYMLAQNQLFRQYGMGNFVDLLIAVAKDPAMLDWLDGKTSTKNAPNENFSRESMELFTLGIGNYSETDVREAARACTGWTLADDGTVAFDPNRWDSGTKTILGQTAVFNMDGANGHPGFLPLVASQAATARYLCTKLFVWFAGDAPAASDLAPMIAAWGTTGNIRVVLRALFTSAGFGAATAMANHAKNPAGWTTGILRGLGIAPPIDATFSQYTAVSNGIKDQGMTLFAPENVGSWPPNIAWLSSGNQIMRFNLAAQMLTGVASLANPATDAFITQLSDQLGGLALSAGVHARLLALTVNNGRATVSTSANGQQAVAQAIVAGPDYQAQ